MKKFKRIFVFLLSLCCLFTTVMNSSLTTVSASNQVKVEILGNGGTYDISGSGATMTGTEYQWHEQSIDVGSSLAASDIIISDPVAHPMNTGWIFDCWTIFDNTDPDNKVKLKTGLTTQDMLSYTIPNHNILIRADWNTSSGGGNTGGGTPGDSGSGSSTVEVMIYADGGDFTIWDPEGHTVTGWTNFSVVPGNSIRNAGYDFSNAYKQGFVFDGWLECTYTIDTNSGMPVCTPVPGATLMTTLEVLNYAIPSTGTAFVAQYSLDTRVLVNFNGNGGEFQVTDGQNSYPTEFFSRRLWAGSTLAAESPNLAITNPVFWDSNRAFEGWMACVRVEHKNDDGSTYNNLEQIAGTGLMTTADAFAYTIPNEDLYFMAMYAGDDSDYYSHVYINGYRAQFTFDEYYWDQVTEQNQTRTHTTEVWGNDLRTDGTSIADQTKDYWKFNSEPTRTDANFEGWLEFKVEWKTKSNGQEYEDFTLVSQKVYTTAEMLALPVPSYDVAYVAKWSDTDFDDYFSWLKNSEVGFNAEPGSFYYEDPLHGVTPSYYNGSNHMYKIGTTLAANGVVVKDPTATGYIFKGWKVCTVEYSENGPVYTQIPNTGLLTTAEALNYVIPDYHIRFVAEWEKDTRPIVNVCFEGNGGEFEVEFNQDKFPTTFFGNDYIVGTTVADAGLKIYDPVFWDKTRGFEGWEICKWVEYKDDDGNKWSELEQVAGTKVLTTAEALAYTVPDFDMVFRAKWAGDDDDYYTQVFINGYHTEFTFEEGFWNEQIGQQEFRPINTEVWGNYLREDGTSIAAQTQDYFKLSSDPVKNGADFEGWLEFKVDITIDENGYWHEEYTLVNENVYSTAQMLAKPVPSYDVAYVAKWSDISIEEYFAKEKIFFLNSNGGEISLKVLEDGHIETTPVNGLGYLNCYTLEEGMNKAGISFEGVHKQCTVLSGWTIYEFDEFEWVEVPAGQELSVGDPDVTFVHWVTNFDENGNKLSDIYLGMTNAKLQFGYASTSQLLSFESGRNNYAVANWQEAHTAAPYVQENIVEPEEGKDGSYDKVIYCSVCKEELDRETIVTTFTSQTVKVEGSDDSFKAETKSALTEVPAEIADKFDTVAEVEQALEDTAKTKNETFDEEKVKIEVVDVELKVFNETTNAWELVDDTNFPANGVTIVLPYPEGTNAANYANFTFEIVHMITSGVKAGQTEVLTPVFKADGIHVTVTSLSPIGIVYQEKAKEPSGNGPTYTPSTDSETIVASPKTSDASMMPMFTMLMFVLFASSVVMMRKKFN